MEESFMNCGKICRRWRLDDCPVEVKTRTESASYRGKPIAATVTAWKGVHMLDDGKQAWRVTRSETWDGGPMGLSLTYNIQPDYTAAELGVSESRDRAVVPRLHAREFSHFNSTRPTVGRTNATFLMLGHFTHRRR